MRELERWRERGEFFSEFFGERETTDRRMNKSSLFLLHIRRKKTEPSLPLLFHSVRRMM